MLTLLFACTDPAPATPASPEVVDEAQTPSRWNLLVWMNGDNDLEDYVVHDLNELEAGGSGDGVNVLVQADRTPGYDDSDGDWTGTRRYRIEADEDEEDVGSPVVEELGEVDMADPAALADFLDWADDRWPAERTLLVLWDHGDSWSMTGDDAAPPPSISSDDTSGQVMSVADGELADALATHPVDVLAFDACLMASWEVGHAVREQAGWLVGSETSIGWAGLQYGPAITRLRDGEDDPAVVADTLARDVVEVGEEPTFSAVDLSAMDALAVAMDALAGRALEDEAAKAALLDARELSRAGDRTWHDYYLDLGDLVTYAAQDPSVATEAEAVAAALDAAVIGVYSEEAMAGIGGLTTMFDDHPRDLAAYEAGTWAAATRWDELLRTLADDTEE